jgi:hypothetical protein
LKNQSSKDKYPNKLRRVTVWDAGHSLLNFQD